MLIGDKRLHLTIKSSNLKKKKKKTNYDNKFMLIGLKKLPFFFTIYSFAIPYYSLIFNVCFVIISIMCHQCKQPKILVSNSCIHNAKY